MGRECSRQRTVWAEALQLQAPTLGFLSTFCPSQTIPLQMILEYNGLQVSDVSVWTLYSTSNTSDRDLSDSFGLFIWSFVAKGDNFFFVATYIPVKSTLTNKGSKGTKTSTLYTQNWTGSFEFSGSRLFGLRQLYLKTKHQSKTIQNRKLYGKESSMEEKYM